MLVHLDLFSGIGGFALACQWAGIETIGFVEIDKYCQKVLRKHWPDVPIVEDIRDVERIKEIVANATSGRFQECELRRETPDDTSEGSKIVANANGRLQEQSQGQIQTGGNIANGISAQGIRNRAEGNREGRQSPTILVTGGFPCQPFSVAGKRRGTADNRYLWNEMFAVIKAIKPAWVLAENVAGIAGMEFTDSVSDLESEVPEEVEAELSAVLDRVCADLEEVGYEVQPIIIPACAVNAPHRRDRVWIIANSTNKRLEGGQKPNGWQEHRWGGGKVGNVPRPVCKDVADSTGIRCIKGRDKYSSRYPLQTGIEGNIDSYSNKQGLEGSKEAGDTESEGAEREEQPTRFSRIPEWWAVEPELGGGSNGFPLWLYRHCGRGLSYEESYRRAEVLRTLWNNNVSKALWFATRGYDRMEQAEILFAFVCQYEEDSNKAWLLVESAEALVEFVFGLWEQSKVASPPPRSEDRKQLQGKYTNTMQELPRLLAYTGKPNWQISSWEDAVPRVAKGIKSRVDRLKCLGNAIVPQVAYEIIKVIADYEDHSV